MSVSRAEVANRALRENGKLAMGQADNSNLTDAALQAYDEVYAYLDNLGITDWSSTAAVPDEYAFWVVAMVAYALIGQLGTPADRVAKITRDYVQAELKIRRVFEDGYTTDATKVSDF